MTTHRPAPADGSPSRSPLAMLKTTPGALAALNAVLILALGVITLAPEAAAQARRTSGGRSKGQYVLVGGQVNTDDNNAVYVLDAVNRDVIALVWNDPQNRFIGVGYRSLTDDAETVRGR